MFKGLRDLLRFQKEGWQLRSYKKMLSASSNPMDKLELEVLKNLSNGGHMGAGYEFLEFKRKFYNALSSDQKDKARQILYKLLQPNYDWMPGMQMRAAHACADLEMDEALPDIKRIFDDPKYEVYQATLRYALQFFEIDLPKDLKFIFTEPYSRKSPKNYEEFAIRYFALPINQQSHILHIFLELMRQPPAIASFAVRALKAYAMIKPEEAKKELHRMKADPQWKDYMELLPNINGKGKVG